ncbi:hypothetical protein D3C80_468020 [compost metagenome]
MSTLAFAQVNNRVRDLAPGLIVSLIAAGAASFLAEHYGAPVMLFALLLGLAMNFLSADGKCKAGIEFTARSVLRLGVALLGMRITLDQMAGLGWKAVALVVILVVVTIGVSMVAAKAMGFQRLFGMLTGGATAICGASAALALAAALPSHPQKERATLFTVIGVSALSTLAMILYPMIANALGLSPQAAGVFLGATIHDVAQVVGAGYSMSTETGDTATGKRPPLLPWFAVGFLILACVNSTGWVPLAVQGSINELSRGCLVVSIAALGMKTQLKELAAVGIKPILLMVGETVFLVLLVLGLMHVGM